MGAEAIESAEPAPSIEVRGLVKAYGEVVALGGISFEVAPGEVVGFLGPNGAGKTTTMKILTCFMAATGGQARVAGFDVHHDSAEVRRRIGYLPENVPLYDEMLVADYLHFIAELRGVVASERSERVRRTVATTGLAEMIGRPVGTLSKGYRQRVGLAQAIIHDPDVVVLDEPTTGLDPNQIVEIRDVIKSIGRTKTVLFSTHIMQEVAAVCDRIVLIDRGRIVADGTIEELGHELYGERARFEVVAPGAEPEALASALGALAASVARSAEEPDALIVVAGQDDPDELARALFGLTEIGIALRSVRPIRPDLEQIFRNFTGAEGAKRAEQEGA